MDADNPKVTDAHCAWGCSYQDFRSSLVIETRNDQRHSMFNLLDAGSHWWGVCEMFWRSFASPTAGSAEVAVTDLLALAYLSSRVEENLEEIVEAGRW